MKAISRWLPLLPLLALGTAVADSEGNAGAEFETAIFAGGCFWCMEKPYDELEGVARTTSGYSGGHVADPSYQEVVAGGTGHREVVRVTYDPEKVSYAELVEVFWRNIDPFDDGGQFCDRGHQYTAAIYYGSEEEREIAESSKERIEEKLGRQAVTEIQPEAPFYPAEEYHQNYYKEQPLKYRYYRWRCGRDDRLEEIWGES